MDFFIFNPFFVNILKITPLKIYLHHVVRLVALVRVARRAARQSATLARADDVEAGPVDVLGSLFLSSFLLFLFPGLRVDERRGVAAASQQAE